MDARVKRGHDVGIVRVVDQHAIRIRAVSFPKRGCFAVVADGVANGHEIGYGKKSVLATRVTAGATDREIVA